MTPEQAQPLLEAFAEEDEGYIPMMTDEALAALIPDQPPPQMTNKEKLDAMAQASGAFYAAAIRIGNHPFIEFTGLMNEYIKICADADAAPSQYNLS